VCVMCPIDVCGVPYVCVTSWIDVCVSVCVSCVWFMCSCVCVMCPFDVCGVPYVCVARWCARHTGQWTSSIFIGNRLMCAYTLYIPHVSLDTSRDTRALMCMSYRAIQIKHLQRQTPSRRPPSIQTGSLRIRCVGCDTIHTILYSRTHETFWHPNTHQNQRGLYETGVKSVRISTLQVWRVWEYAPIFWVHILTLFTPEEWIFSHSVENMGIVYILTLLFSHSSGVKSVRISTLYPYSPHCTHAAEHMKLSDTLPAPITAWSLPDRCAGCRNVHIISYSSTDFLTASRAGA